MKKGLVFIGLLLLVAKSGFALSGEKLYAGDMELMRKQLGKEQKFSAQLLVTNKNIKGFIPAITATIQKSGGNVYYKVLHLEYLFGEHYTVVVNHKSKSIAYSQKDDKNMAEIKAMVPNLDSLMGIYDSVVYLGDVKGDRKYMVYNGNGVIKIAEVYFNPALNFISKLVYHYNPEITGEEATLVVEYRNVQFSTTYNAADFSESRFIMRKGKTWAPVPQLADYSITKAKTDFGEY